jgi:hypothetical protein
MERISFEQLNKIDLVDFLASIGIQPKKRKAWRYYYRSPLTGHPAHRSTFIVNRRSNRWRETTSKQSGALTDLVIQLYHCTIGELTTIVRSVVPPVPQSGFIEGPGKTPQVTIEQTHPIRSAYLERYLWERRITLHVARHYLLEAWYKREKNLYHALAFPNNAGGFELFDRNRHFRVQPYGPTLICYQSKDIAIFRDALDLLTFAALFAGPVKKFPDFLILNAPVAFQAVQQIIAPYTHKHLFLPNDDTGIAFGTKAASTLQYCHDHRSLYAGYTTMNDWICRIGTAPGPIIPRSPADAHDSHLTGPSSPK